MEGKCDAIIGLDEGLIACDRVFAHGGMHHGEGNGRVRVSAVVISWGDHMVRQGKALLNSDQAELSQRRRNQVLTDLLQYLVHNFVDLNGIPDDMGIQIREALGMKETP